MTLYKEEKTASLIKDIAADFIQRESNKISLITVTRVVLSNKGKNAQILFTVYPQNREGEAIEFAARIAGEFREYVKSRARMRVIPFFRFEIDRGEKNRQRLDRLGNKSEV